MPSSARRARNRGFTLVEAVIALTLSGLLMSAVTTHWLKSATLGARISRTLEHSRNARQLIDTLSMDLRAAQLTQLYTDFSSRGTEARDGQTGNYLVLQSINGSGTITRTVGYYAVALGGDSGWTVHRHDSANGDNPVDGLPATTSLGSHRLIKRALRLPDAGHMFRCVRDRGISVHGEFGPPETRGPSRTEFIRWTILTRS